MGKAVKFAKTKDVIFIGGTIGELGNTFPPVRKSVEISMTIDEEGLLMKIKKDLTQETILVPLASVMFAVLADNK